MNRYILGDLSAFYLASWLSLTFKEENQNKVGFQTHLTLLHYQLHEQQLAYLRKYWTPTALQPIFELVKRIGVAPKIETNTPFLAWPSFLYFIIRDFSNTTSYQFDSLEKEYITLTQKLRRLFNDMFQGNHGFDYSLVFLNDNDIKSREDILLLHKFHLRIREYSY